MSKATLRDFKALTFDVYGTLIDWETGITTALRPLTDRLSHELSPDDILEAHARQEASQQAATPTKPYNEILAIVYRRLAEGWRLDATWDECLRYGSSVKDWPVFPDSREALQYLKEHYRLFVLSNVDNVSFAHSNVRLGITFDGVYTAEDVGSYKPCLDNFSYMIDRLADLEIASSDVLHTAESLFHDHVPANAVGLTGCHIYRRAGLKGSGATMATDAMPDYAFRFTSMAAFVEAHRSS